MELAGRLRAAGWLFFTYQKLLAWLESGEILTPKRIGDGRSANPKTRSNSQ
jgi:hypothetical protein